MRIRQAARIAAVALASMLLLPAAAPSTFASDAPPQDPVVELSDSDLGVLTAFFDEYGVHEDTRAALIAKYEAGELWDSLTGVAPVSVQTVRREGAVTRVSRFPDGSVSATTSPDLSRRLPSSGATTQNYGLYNCPESGNGTYRNCRVDRNDGLVRIYYKVDITYNAGTSGRIFNLWDCTPFTIGGSAKDVSCAIEREYGQATPYYPARALGKFLYDAPVGSATVKIYLYVFRGNAWTAI